MSPLTMPGPRAPERRSRPGLAVPHTICNCDTQLQRLLREMGGQARHAAFDVWLDERLRAMQAELPRRRIEG